MVFATASYSWVMDIDHTAYIEPQNDKVAVYGSIPLYEQKRMSKAALQVSHGMRRFPFTFQHSLP